MSMNRAVSRGWGPKRLLAGLALSVAMLTGLIAASAAPASSGGIGPGGTTTETTETTSGGDDTNLTPPRFERLWEQVSREDRRWARRTAECESGRDPNALALGGDYRGAFMFTWNAWKIAPKSPGGDPIDYSYRTQAVVAVGLMHKMGTDPWPVCG